MQKTISIIRGFKDESYKEFHERISAVIEEIKTGNLSSLSYTITMEKPPKIGVIPFSKEKIAMVSVWSEEDNHLSLIQQQDGYSGTYEVTEALPVAYEKTWKDEEATPGVCLLTLFRQRKGITYDEFIDRWYNGHTPLTLKIHPVYHYSRNQVVASQGDPSQHYDGIVEEHCRTRKTLLNPFVFFAKSGFALVNMVKTYFDVKGFIDYKSIETYLVAEFVISS